MKTVNPRLLLPLLLAALAVLLAACGGDEGSSSRSSEATGMDRAFVEAMIPHPQAKEIDEMNTWRVDWYGGLSPPGGVPPEAHEEAKHH